MTLRAKRGRRERALGPEPFGATDSPCAGVAEAGDSRTDCAGPSARGGVAVTEGAWAFVRAIPSAAAGYRGRARKSSGHDVDTPTIEDGREEDEGGVENSGGAKKGNGEPYDDVSRETNGAYGDELGENSDEEDAGDAKGVPSDPC